MLEVKACVRVGYDQQGRCCASCASGLLMVERGEMVVDPRGRSVGESLLDVVAFP